jgi:hypothetical protein
MRLPLLQPAKMQWRHRRHDSASSTLAIWNAGTSSQCSDRPLCDNRSKKDWKGTPLQTSAVESAFFLKIWVLFICSSANYRLMYINYYNLLYQRLLSTNLTQSTQRFLWTHSVLLACFTGPLAIQYIPRMCDSENSRSIGKFYFDSICLNHVLVQLEWSFSEFTKVRLLLNKIGLDISMIVS